MILTARLRPGAPLVERDLAAQLGISRTPIREAIARLTAEGLIIRRRRRGYLVTAMGAEQVAGLYAVREALEALAVRLAIKSMGSAAHRRLEAAVEAAGSAIHSRRGNASVARPGLRVHDLIVRQSGNPFLYETWRRLIEKILPYVWIETLYADDAVRTLREHRQLCRCIRRGNVVAAEKLIRDHIGRARDNLVRVLMLQVGGDLPVNSRSRDGQSVRRGS
jgi:DNA-binding GntR family transcriptional regulator